jgi:hypothetical protein
MKKTFYLYALVLGFAISSCEKSVEVEPKNSIAPNAVITTLSGNQAVLASAYDRLQSFGYWGRDMALLGDAMADNIYTEVNIAGGRYTGNNLNQRGSHYGFWGTAYVAINDVNTVIANIDGVPGSATAIAQAKAEALALRAMVYFDLARTYGYEPTKIQGGFDRSVVLRLSPSATPSDASPRRRTSVDSVYKAIEKDLKDAIALFPASNTSRFRLNKPAAQALLGKVYLYWEKWGDAVTQFDAALAGTPATQIAAGAYVTAFNTASVNQESLFEIPFITSTEMSGVTGANDSPFSYTNPSGRNSFSTFGGQTASDELMALFEAGDDRRSMFFQFGGTSATASPVFNWCAKYRGSVGAYTDNIKVIRFSDVVLMKAEALAEQNQFQAAADLVIALRARRNATTNTVPNTSAIKDYIQTERRRELFFEGHRWFDLKRKGAGITKPAKTAVGSISAADYRILPPLPVSEVTLLPTLPNNPNY